MVIDEPQSIEQIATEWLEAERRATAGDNLAGLEDRARTLSDRYDDAIRAASSEELRLAWEAAKAIQSRCDVGSAEWAAARQVSELLRAEYAASRDAATTPTTD